MSEMKNFPMQLVALPNSITKEFQGQEKTTLSLILNKPKAFKDFENSDKQRLGTSLTQAVGYLGIKEVLTDEYLKSLVNILCDEMPSFTIEELEKAIIMASMGKFEDFDNRHFNQLTPIYVSNIVKEYKKHRGIVFQKYQRIQERIRRETEPQKMSKKDTFYLGLELLENEYEDYLSNADEYCDSEYRDTQFKHLYSYLTKHRLIESRKCEDVSELKSYILSWFRAIEKKDTNPRTYICKKFNIPEHK